MKSGESKPNEIRLPAPHEEVLGIFLKDGGSLFRENRHRLQSQMFFEYEWLFKIMLEVDLSELVTFRSVAARCRDRVELLHNLRNCVASLHVLPALIETMKKRALASSLQNISRRVLNQTMEENCDADEVLRELQEKAFALSSSESDGISDPERDVEEWHQWLNEIMEDPSKAFGLLTGLDDIDRITTGWHRTDFIVIGARPSIGKSAFLLENILRLTKAGYKCGLFSLEMTKRQIYNRMLANLMGVNLETLRTGQLAKERLHEIEKWKPLLKKIFVDDSRGVTSDYIVDAMRHLKRSQGLDFVAVDYIQEVKERGEHNDNQGSALGRICRKLRAGAKEVDCAVMALSQVSRSVEERQDKRPSIADLSGSTGIETAADVIGLLYRDDYYNKDSSTNIMEINFGKQRNGKVGKAELHYDRDYQRLRTLLRR